VQRWLLPGNTSRYAKNILLALRANSTSPVVGGTLVDAGLNKLNGARVVGHKRRGVFFRYMP
jgi:hypothetical protein